MSIGTTQDAEERLCALRLFCTPLLEGVHDPTQHFDKLDQQLSLLLPRPDGVVKEPPTTDSVKLQDSCSKVEGLLSRLPEVPQRSFSLPLNNGLMRKQGSTLWDGIRSGTWATKYVVPEARSHLQQQPSEDAESILNLLNRVQDLAWDSLYVTRYIDSNSLTLATIFAHQGAVPNLDLGRQSLRYVDILSELFDEYQSMRNAAALWIRRTF